MNALYVNQFEDITISMVIEHAEGHSFLWLHSALTGVTLPAFVELSILKIHNEFWDKKYYDINYFLIPTKLLYFNMQHSNSLNSKQQLISM